MNWSLILHTAPSKGQFSLQVAQWGEAVDITTSHRGAAAHPSCASTRQARIDSEQQRDPQPHFQEGPYLQLLRMGGEGSHFPNGLCPPQDEGQTGQLSCDTGNIHTLQGMEADLPCLHRHRQPAIPAGDRDHPHIFSRKRLTRDASRRAGSQAATGRIAESSSGGTLCTGLGLATLC